MSGTLTSVPVVVAVMCGAFSLLQDPGRVGLVGVDAVAGDRLGDGRRRNSALGGQRGQRGDGRRGGGRPRSVDAAPCGSPSGRNRRCPAPGSGVPSPGPDLLGEGPHVVGRGDDRTGRAPGQLLRHPAGPRLLPSGCSMVQRSAATPSRRELGEAGAAPHVRGDAEVLLEQLGGRLTSRRIVPLPSSCTRGAAASAPRRRQPALGQQVDAARGCPSATSSSRPSGIAGVRVVLVHDVR